MNQTRPIRVAIAGALGRMGREAVATLEAQDDFAIAGLLVRDSTNLPADFRHYATYDAAITLLETESPDVWLDLTNPQSVVRHVDLAIAHGVRPVIGATGYTAQDIERWRQTADPAGLGVLVCPNFALGALLMMRFAKEAAHWMPRAEIIEMHHDGKLDKPSGTALRTVDLMDTDYEIPIHSVRLPGLVAHQAVIFGGTGETLTLRHDSLSRASFRTGMQIACEKVMRLGSVVVGLEHVLW